MGRWIHGISDWTDSLIRAVTVVTAGSFTLLVFISVLTRYVFATPIMSSQEISKLLFVWSAFLAATIAYKRHSHIRFEFLNRMLGPKGLALTDFLFYGVSFVFFLVILVKSIEFTGIVWPTFLPVLNMSQGWLYMAVVVSSVVFLIHTVSLFLGTVERLRESFVGGETLRKEESR